MRSRIHLWAFTTFLITVAASADAQTKSNGPPQSALMLPAPNRYNIPERASTRCVVASIIDGDTLRCEGLRRSVRLLLIDAPEKDQGPYAVLATRALAQLVPAGTVVWLEYDIQRADRYDRNLSYIWRQDSVLVNEELARAGYVLPLTYPPNVRYVDRIRAAVEEAEAEKRGLWAGSAFECTPKDFRAKKC